MLVGARMCLHVCCSKLSMHVCWFRILSAYICLRVDTVPYKCVRAYTCMCVTEHAWLQTQLSETRLFHASRHHSGTQLQENWCVSIGCGKTAQISPKTTSLFWDPTASIFWGAMLWRLVAHAGNDGVIILVHTEDDPWIVQSHCDTYAHTCVHLHVGERASARIFLQLTYMYWRRGYRNVPISMCNHWKFNSLSKNK